MGFHLLADPVLLFGGFGIISFLIAVITSIFWLWMLIDCLLNNAINGTEKLIWVLVILFTHIIGAILYYFLARRGRTGGAAL